MSHLLKMTQQVKLFKCQKYPFLTLKLKKSLVLILVVPEITANALISNGIWIAQANGKSNKCEMRTGELKMRNLKSNLLLALIVLVGIYSGSVIADSEEFGEVTEFETIQMVRPRPGQPGRPIAVPRIKCYSNGGLNGTTCTATESLDRCRKFTKSCMDEGGFVESAD